MALIWADRVRETTTTTGTGALTLAGAATGYRTFASQMSTNDTCYGFVAHQEQAEWEICLFTMGAGGTLARTTVLASSNGGSTVSFSAGTKDVLLDVPASVISTFGGGGSGTVTSVGLSLPGIFAVSGSPVTSSGTLAVTLAAQSANAVWAGPTTGAAAAPTFRTLTTADVPDLSGAYSVVGHNHDGAYSPLGHNHDTRYYTEAEVDGLLATYQSLDADLTALAALGSTGYARRAGEGTWALDATVPWSSVSSAPTTLSGYGITDAQPLDGDLTALAGLSGTNTIYYRSGANTWSAVTIGSGLSFSGGTLSASGGSSDLVSPLTSAEISITTTATATVSRAHVCTGTSVDYVVTLPSPGTAGRLIAIRLASTMTKLVTLDAGSGNLVDGSQTLVLQAGESVVLLSDGSIRWNTVACRRIAMQCQLVRASAQSGIAHDVRTKILLDLAPFDKGALADLANSRILIRRPGRYLVQASWGLVSTFDNTERVIAWVYKNATTDVSTAREIVNFVLSPAAGQSLIVVAQRVLDLAAGDYLLMWVEQTSGGTISTSAEVPYRPTLTVTEVL